jgi:hypothetical protein
MVSGVVWYLEKGNGNFRERLVELVEAPERRCVLSDIKWVHKVYGNLSELECMVDQP